jgi:hypothetical protein
MTDHFHLLVKPSQAGKVCSVYQMRPITDREPLYELNQVRAGLVNRPREHPWGSYEHRAMGRFDRLLDEDPWYAGLAIDESSIKGP